MDWQKRQEARKKISLYLPLYGLFTLLCVIGLILTLNTATAVVEPLETIIEQGTLPQSQEVSLKQKIINYSSSYGVDASKALKIADCESKTGKYLFNFEGGSAKGIFQFTDKTWNAYCEGNVLNTDDNVKCFVKLYNKNPNWWACKA